MDPPRPPPHGGRGGLPPGQYDIFVIPPHSAGSGFLYLPSLQPHRNSFLAGVACTLLAVGVWILVIPVLREWFSTIVASGGMGVVILLVSVGVAGWAWGKTQLEKEKPGNGHTDSPPSAGAGTTGPSSGRTAGGAPFGGTSGPGFSAGAGFGGARPPPTSSWQRATPNPTDAGAAKGGWEKAREETRKKEEERRKADELKKKREDDEKERIKRREKDAQEREAREKRQKEANDRARNGDASASASPNRTTSPNKKYQQPTARTAADDDASYSYRPYDRPARPTHHTAPSTSSYSASSYAPSASTARTSPPPSHARGPYSSKDPDKIVLKAVYSFNHAFTKTPIAKLVSGKGSVTDGLILRITTEGLFIDDDVRGVPQREWDIKAWTMKHVESGEHKGLHLLRANIRDQEGKRYLFVLQEEEGWKLAVGLQKLRRGTQVRALGVSGMAAGEAKSVLESMGWL